MKKIETYFRNNTVFTINAIGAFVAGMVVLIMQIITEYNANSLKDHVVILAIMAMEFISTLFIYITYQRHVKNETKTLLGVLLTCLLLNSIHSLKVCNFSTISLIQTLLLAVIFVNHLLINISRKSKPVQIIINQLTIIGILIIQLYSYIAIYIGVYAAQYNAFDFNNILNIVLCIITSIMSLTTIVCVETKMDFYKSKREDAGWTEETGYPEGYVHQKDR